MSAHVGLTLRTWTDSLARLLVKQFSSLDRLLLELPTYVAKKARTGEMPLALNRPCVGLSAGLSIHDYCVL
jgi:hypothetical protein